MYVFVQQRNEAREKAVNICMHVMKHWFEANFESCMKSETKIMSSDVDSGREAATTLNEIFKQYEHDTVISFGEG